MIHLTYSNRTEALLDALAGDLGERRARTSPLEPLRLVVPNRNVETWVKQGLARRLGISANLEVLHLNRMVQRLLDPMRGAPLLDGGALFDATLALLLDGDLLLHRELERVREYLFAAGTEEGAVSRRRFELARRVSRLLEEYGLSRPEMLQAWEAGPVATEGRFRETETWQRRIWLEIVERNPERTPFPALLAGLERPSLGGAPVFIFGISYVAHAFHRILAGMAREGELHVYTLNPCEEFWEDLESGRETARRLRRVGEEGLAGEDPFGLRAEGENPALSLWGRPGRENIRLLNELADCDFRSAFSEPGGNTLLHRIQTDILRREPEREEPDPSFDFEGDRSVEILACPGARREAEAIASKIWDLVEADAALRFNDIAVLVAGPEPEVFFSHLAAALEETHAIPFSLSDVSFSSGSSMGQGVEALLRLPLGRLRRSDVLRFITHPAVLARFKEADPDGWVRTVDRLGIIEGADRSDLEATYLEEDLLSWDQGLRRLALGGFVPGGRTGEPEITTLDGPLPGEGRYLPLEAEGGGELGALLRSLLSDVEFARGARLGTEEWARFFETSISTYLLPRGDAERRELDRCLAAVRKIGELRLEGREIPLSLAVELACAELASLGGGVGNYLAEGVVVSTLQPMRAIPFRAVFIAGLGEGRFPSPEKRDDLDLRLASPRVGDVSPRESDQYMFLEAILCTREFLTLSYVARNEQTGDPLPASTTLAAFMRMIGAGYLGKEEVARRVPLHPWEGERKERHASPRAVGERRITRIRESLLEAGEARRLDLREILASLDAKARREVDSLLRIHRPEGAEEERARRVVSLAQLRKFLECPLQGSVAARLGLREDQEDLSDRPTEPFASGGLQRALLLRGATMAWLRSGGGNPIASEYDRLRERLTLEGTIPSGIFGAVEREEHLAWLEAWRERLQGFGPPPLRILRFGGAREGESIDESREPLLLEGELPVEIGGTTEALLGDDTTLVIVGSARRGKTPAEALRVFLNHVILSAAGEASGRHVGRILHADPAKPEISIAFAPISGEEARKYLRSLADDLFGQTHAYFLPYDAVLEARKAGAGGIAGALERVRARDSGGSAFGPIRNPRDFPTPGEEEASEMIERRFSLFFERMEGASK